MHPRVQLHDLFLAKMSPRRTLTGPFASLRLVRPHAERLGAALTLAELHHGLRNYSEATRVLHAVLDALFMSNPDIGAEARDSWQVGYAKCPLASPEIAAILRSSALALDRREQPTTGTTSSSFHVAQRHAFDLMCVACLLAPRDDWLRELENMKCR